MGILVDTSVIVDYLRRKDNTNSWFYKLSLKGNILYISIITHAELHSGKSVHQSPRHKKILDEIISKLSVIAIDLPTSALAGKIRAKTNRDLLDCFIGATAIKSGHSLATLNTKHFVGMKDLDLVKPPR